LSEPGEREAVAHLAFEVRPQARADIEAVYAWYEQQRPGLGKSFVRAVDSALAAVRDRPEMYARVHGDIRRATLRGYPYGVFYLAEPGAVVMVAVTHHKRHPRHWRGRH
jgi:plasmid stabilization system protein ParE